MFSIRPGRPCVNQRASTTAVVVIAAAIVAGCSPSPLPPEPVVESSDQLLEALRAAGAAVEEVSQPAQVGPLQGGRTFALDGTRLELFDFETADARQVAARALTEADSLPTEEPLVAWGRGRLIVAYRGSDGGVIALLGGFLGDPLTLPRDVVEGPYPPGVAASIAYLAQDLDVDPGTIVVVDFEAVEWHDSCLGLGRPEELCAQVETPGWRITLRLGESTYRVHSDEFGQVVRKE